MTTSYMEDDQWFYTQCYWYERRHKRTGEVLESRWRIDTEYDNLESAKQGLADSQQEHPDLKFKLTRTYTEILHTD